MSATFSPLPAAAGGALTKALNADGKQPDSSLPGGFGSLLDQAFEQAPLTQESELADAPGVDNLFATLQDLPEGGKLLPLLQQVLDSAEMQGLDPQQVLEQIADNIEQLQAESGLNPLQAAVVALTQLLDPQRLVGQGPATLAQKPGTLAQGFNVPLMEGVAVEGADTDGTPANSTDLQRFIAETSTSRAIKTETVLNGAAPELPRPGDGKLMNSPAMLSDQPLPVTDRGQAEAANIMSVLRQLTAEGGKRPLASDILSSTPVSAASATMVQLPPGTLPATSMMPAVSIDASLNQADWDQAFGEKIQWMVSQRMQGAQIRLNPANLGALDVRIQVQNDQATIQFTSAHAVVREALDAAMPRLREMMEASGVELMDVNVSDQSSAEQQRADEQDDRRFSGSTASAEEESETILVSEVSSGSVRATGQLDIFA